MFERKTFYRGIFLQEKLRDKVILRAVFIINVTKRKKDINNDTNKLRCGRRVHSSLTRYFPIFQAIKTQTRPRLRLHRGNCRKVIQSD